jgi:putative transcriptional regulator
MMVMMSNPERPDDQASGDEKQGGPSGSSGRRARSSRSHRPAAGMLLVATSELHDPQFRRTVVYLVAHGDEGSAGLVLNRRTETAVHSVLPGWVSHVAKPQAVYSGGPVQPSGAMCLGVSRGGYFPGEGSGLVRVAGRVVLVDLDSEPATAAATLTGVRIFAGHAGWGEGQLAAEIAEGAWFVVPGMDNDILTGPMVDLYFRSLKRQGFPLAWEAYRPVDLERN